MGRPRPSDLLIDQVIDREPGGHNERWGLVRSEWRGHQGTITFSRDKSLSKNRRVRKGSIVT